MAHASCDFGAALAEAVHEAQVMADHQDGRKMEDGDIGSRFVAFAAREAYVNAAEKQRQILDDRCSGLASLSVLEGSEARFLSPRLFRNKSASVN